MGDRRGDRAPARDRRWPTSSGRCGPRRPGRSGSASWSALVRPVGPAGGAAGPAGLVRRAGGRLLDQPAEAGRRVAADRRGAGRAPADRPQDLALLRDLRRRGGPLAPARQLPGRLDRLRRPGRAPDLADQQGDAPALDPRGARLRLSRPRRPCSTAWRRPSTPSTGWRSTRGTSTTGTTPRPSGPCRRLTSRPSTAATCSAAW